MWKLPDQDLEALVSEFERSSWREMHLRIHDVELILAKDAAPIYREIPREDPRPAPATAAAPSAFAASSSGAGKQEPVIPPGCTPIRAPTLGTFYRSAKPGVPPFIEVGDEVTPETEVCLVEVMKLFTTVRAGVTGIVREIYAQDGELVEFEQALFLVEPRG